MHRQVEDLDKQLPEPVRKAKCGPVPQGLANDIKNNVQKMQDILLRTVSDIAPGDYIDAKRYLNMLEESAKALNDPNVSNYFNDKWTAKGKKVGELVEHMTSKDD